MQPLTPFPKQNITKLNSLVKLNDWDQVYVLPKQPPVDLKPLTSSTIGTFQLSQKKIESRACDSLDHQGVST
ncbi:hypothetical protein BJP34_23240 [Moorena producens PAL-8-15-08-1]|uniref:Uncharacterized protein n=1 Tax=Moorena producens PAL-8-15-08-1 TaxID=1458985 RepID=A0A1D8TWW4_9CYAN|nr:hypothetical protein BJP34_23240 [Moorena producens PAL-8-15-08-1]